ncbi:DUF1302 family protein [Gilvimarinus chinensis]|uniref:DUF1302 family protein n=1 Tax=Gilvimarinus chinensis TaxID=396005 RepID=UPI00035C83A2|nr:DUF1302 family protein [Gilvimarinus chinensis]
MKPLGITLFALAATQIVPVQAEDFFSSVTTSAPRGLNLQSPWSHRAWLQQKTGYGWHTPAVAVSRDQAALTRTETQLFGELGWREGQWRAQLSGSLVHDWLPDLERAGVWSAYEFNAEQIHQRRWRLELADSFVSWEGDDWWLKAGYQTLPWGEAESLKITDVLARRDQRWPGQEDLEKLRLPVASVRISWQNRLDLVTLIEPLPDRLPAAYDEFDPYLALRTGEPTQDPALIRQSDSNPGFALRYRHHWQGMDAQLMLADVTSYELAPTGIDDTGAQPQVFLEPWRQQVAGLGLQAVRGNLLLRSEQAWHHNTKVAQANPLAPWRSIDQWRGMLGADYSGINNLTLTAELSWLYIHHWDSNLDGKRWQPGASARASYNLYNERLTLQAFAMMITGNQGSLIRLSADWAVSDEFSIGITAIEYDGHDPQALIYPYRHNDTLLVTLRWGL